MTQIDRLEQAKKCLERLRDGIDPISGAALSDTCPAREDKVRKEIFSWIWFFGMVLAEDAPVDTSGNPAVFFQYSHRVFYGAWQLENLAQGCHPQTGESLDPRDPLTQEELREEFAFLANALRNSLLAGYFTAKAPFSLPRGTAVPTAREAVEMDCLLEGINALRDADAVRALTPSTLEPYLASQGLLAEKPEPGSRKTYLPAPDGEALGITQVECTKPDGRPGTTLVFSPQAQQYVADHMDDLIAYLADPSRWAPPRKGGPIRQIDVLKHARRYLEQLSRGTDPLTGKDISDSSVAGEAYVHELLESCALDLMFMALHDEIQRLPDGRGRLGFSFVLDNSEMDPRVRTQDAVVESILGMKRLAQGCHPQTGERLDPRDPLTQERLRKCFAFVERAERNTFIACAYTAREPFYLSPEARSKLTISPEPMNLTGLVSIINSLLEDQTAVRGLAPTKVLDFLEDQLLLESGDGGGDKKGQPTPLGEEMGFRWERIVEQGRAPYYNMILYPQAKQYVCDHLDGFLEIQALYTAIKKRALERKLLALEWKPTGALPGDRPMTQLDRLRQARYFLSKLAKGIDPITGTALGANSAAREEKVRKTLLLCCNDLVKMFAYDNSEPGDADHDPCFLTVQDRVLRNRAIRCMELLSQGCHPDTKAGLDPQDPLGREELRRCYAFVAQSLRNALDAGYVTAKAPFFLSPEARARIHIFRDSVNLVTLGTTINAQREDDTTMRALGFKLIVQYLLSQGLLTQFPGGELTHTPKGEALGLVCRQLIDPDDPNYVDVICAPDVQRYIVDHLDDISDTWTFTQSPLSQSESDRLKSLSDAFRQAGEPGERQVDALARAKGYLEQLHACTDPLTGKDLSGNQVLGNAKIERLFCTCVITLEKMIRYDSDGLRHVNRISDVDFWQKNAQGMERLALGCRPDTGASLDPQDPLAQEGLRGCFAFVAMCLRRALNSRNICAKVPFFLPTEARPKGPISQDSISMTDFLRAINALREDDTAMDTLTPTPVRQYLVSQDVLAEVSNEAGKIKSVPGPRSKELGITQVERVHPPEKGGGSYLQVVYGPAAQQYIVEHLDDIIALQGKK